MPKPVRWEATYGRAAREVAAMGLAADGPRCVLLGGWGPCLRRCGWPVGRTVVDRPQVHSSGRRKGEATAPAPQPAATAPEGWLVALAQTLRVPLRQVAAGRLTEAL